MDPVFQRLGDVTIQRLDKPKENRPEHEHEGGHLEKEEKTDESMDIPQSPPPVPVPVPVPPVEEDDLQAHKRIMDELPGPSHKKSRMEELERDFSGHSFSDHDLTDYESDVESDGDVPNAFGIPPPKVKIPMPGPELECANSNFEEESQEPGGENNFLEQLVQEPFLNEDEIKTEPENKDDEYDYDIKEKLKEMGEISFETVKKGDSKPKKPEINETEVSVVPAKKTPGEEDAAGAERKSNNLRRNIREVMDETKLDESTLAAQRQEAERLRRVQEQQRLIREAQRQVTQEKVISILQGNNMARAGTSAGTKIGNTVLVKLPNGQTKPMTKLNKKPYELMRVPKGSISPQQRSRSMLTLKRPPTAQTNLTPSVSIAPVGKRPMVYSRPTSESDSDSEDMSTKMVQRPKVCSDMEREAPVTTIDISSDDDCIVVSESENDPSSDEVEDPTNSGMHTNDEFNQPDEQGRVVINIGHPEDESDIYLAPQIARIIKPHQIGGIRFLYDNIIESTNRFETSTGFGCILAHSMGLGKTLQVVTFSDIFLRHTMARTILCIMPINTLQNWLAEYNMWLPTEDASPNSPLLAHGEVRPRNFNLHVLNDSHKTLAARAKVIHEWKSAGGVLLIGYEQYRLLSLKKYPKSRSKKPEQRICDEDRNKLLFEEVHEALVKPGPDLVICDEGHRIKNSHASISQALKQMRTKRRVVLTGYPLQNNLMEYWCMVDFVRPNYLGTKTEFCNMFERPIQNGQCIDSTESDIKLMRYRAHVLHSLLLGFVQRRSHRVLQTALPQKEEYVLLVRMTEFQRTLYETFMNEVVRTQTVPNPLKAFAVCCKIWNHPDVLYYFLKKQDKGEAVDIDLEEVSNSTGSSETPAKSKSRAKKQPKGKNAKPAASITPYNTNAVPPETPPATPGSNINAPTATSNQGGFNNSGGNFQSGNFNNTNNYQQQQNYNNQQSGFNPNQNQNFGNFGNNQFPGQIKSEPNYPTPEHSNFSGDSNFSTNQNFSGNFNQNSTSTFRIISENSQNSNSSVSNQSQSFRSATPNTNFTQNSQQSTFGQSSQQGSSYAASNSSFPQQSSFSQNNQSTGSGYAQNSQAQNSNPGPGFGQKANQQNASFNQNKPQGGNFIAGNPNFPSGNQQQGQPGHFPQQGVNYGGNTSNAPPPVNQGNTNFPAPNQHNPNYSQQANFPANANFPQQSPNYPNNQQNQSFPQPPVGNPQNTNFPPPSGSSQNQNYPAGNQQGNQNFPGQPNQQNASFPAAQQSGNFQQGTGFQGGNSQNHNYPPNSQGTANYQAGNAQGGNFPQGTQSGSYPQQNTNYQQQNMGSGNFKQQNTGYPNTSNPNPQNPNLGIQQGFPQNSSNAPNPSFQQNANTQNSGFPQNASTPNPNFPQNTNSQNPSFPQNPNTQNSNFPKNANPQNTTFQQNVNAQTPNFPKNVNPQNPNFPQNANTQNPNFSKNAIKQNPNFPQNTNTPNPNFPQNTNTQNPKFPQNTSTQNPKFTQNANTQNPNFAQNTNPQNPNFPQGNQPNSAYSPANTNQAVSSAFPQGNPQNPNFPPQSGNVQNPTNPAGSQQNASFPQNQPNSSYQQKPNYPPPPPPNQQNPNYQPNPQATQNYPPNNPPFQENNPNFNPPNETYQQSSNYRPNYTSPNAQPTQQPNSTGYNYQNQTYWNQQQSTDVKPPAQQDNYYNNYNQPWNNQWVKKEDIKPIKSEQAEVKPKINIISDIQITNVYDSMGNISPEKKINILSDIKLEPKKEEAEFKEEPPKPEIINKMPEVGKMAEPNKLEDDDVKLVNEVNPVVKPTTGKEDTGIPYDWAKELMKDYIPGCIENSAKMEILFCIIKESIALGDRLLVFSQSLITLDLIEQFLQMNLVPGDTQHWGKNTNYYRLDGSTSALEREKLINEFNSNAKVHVFLVSTRAGSLGINLIGANRVIVLDASWNPCHDTQAVCRVYRYGQRKPCFVYRLVVDNCLEKKIYDRQINKQGMSDRVVDECNPDAHLTMKDVSTLCWDDEQESAEQDWSHTKENYIDVVLQKVLEQHGRRFNKEPFQHESLLIDRKDKQLSRQEKRLAKKGYEREKQAARQPSYNVQTGARHRPVASVRPMQQGGDRPTRWIPAEHWQRQGMTAQEMTLPLDVVIPTNQPDKGNIVLKAGQKVLVLKSPKGVYMQLESGKIVAIKTAIKVRGKADEEANKVKATLPAAIKNNSAISVLPQKRPPVKPTYPTGMAKLNMRSVKQSVPNLVNQINKVSKKVQMVKTRPYHMGAEIAKAVKNSHDMDLHPISSSEDERSSDKRVYPYRGESQISLLKTHMSRSESDEGENMRSEDDSRGSSKDEMMGIHPHSFKQMKAGLAKSNSTTALQQLEQSTSAIISESKQPFQETLDSITSSYQDDKSDELPSRKEPLSSQSQPIQIEDDSPVELDESYEQTASTQSTPAPSEPSAKSDIPTPEYGYNNYYGYNPQPYPPPPPPQGYPGYPPQPPPYDVSLYPPQQQPYNYGVYPPQGYPPQPQYPPPHPAPQPYDYTTPPPPQPLYAGYTYPPQQYPPPPPPQGLYPPPGPAAPYPEYQYPAGGPAAPPPPVAPSYYPPQT